MKNTKHITMGAMTLGLSAIIQLLDRSTVGLFMSFLAVPLIIYGFFFSFKSSVVVYIASIGLSFALTGYLPSIITVAGYGFVGLVLIFGMQMKWSSRKRFIAASIAIIPVYVVMVGFFGVYFGYDIPAGIRGISHALPFISETLAAIIIYLGAVVLAIMEVYIIKLSSELLIALLDRRFNR